MHPRSWWCSRKKSPQRTCNCASFPSSTFRGSRSCCRQANAPTAYTSSTSCAARPTRETASQKVSSRTDAPVAEPFQPIRASSLASAPDGG
eukprot:scaffold123456_cov30-Tisochrysis_lutea.AAC.2